MSGLRLLFRATPFLLGAAAAALWLRRDGAELPMLPPPREAALDRKPADVEGAATELESRPIDIVTIVDDLLLAGR
jgi:hypothetical protein